MVKHNFLIHQPLTYIIILLFVLFAVFVNIPGSFSFVVTFFTIIVSLFFYDHHHKAQKFTLSLPVSKKEMVNGRYYFSIIIIITTLLIMWVWMNILSSTPLPLDGRYLYHWKDVIILFAIGSVMIGFTMPILYLLPLKLSIIIIAIGYFISTFFYTTIMIDSLHRDNADLIVLNDMDAGLTVLAEKIIPFQPYVILLIGSIMILYVSMKLSTFIVKRRDV